MDSHPLIEAIDNTQLLANQLKEPVCFADTQLHRRGHVHYVWWPDENEPAIYKNIVSILNDAKARRYRRAHFIADLENPTLHTVLLGTGSRRDEQL